MQVSLPWLKGQASMAGDRNDSKEKHNSTTTELHCTMEKHVFLGGGRLQKMCVWRYPTEFDTKNMAILGSYVRFQECIM